MTLTKTRIALGLVGLELAMWLPSVFAHPSFLREEWDFIGGVQNNGPLGAADGPTAAMRPAVRLIYAGVYETAINTQWAIAIAPILSALVGIAFFVFLRQLIGDRRAAVSSAIWIFLPTHLTSSHWLAASNIEISMLLGLLGCRFMTNANKRTAFLGGVIAGTGVLCYEASAPIVLVATIVLPSALIPRRERALPALMGLVPFIATAGILSVGPRQKLFVSPLKSLYFNFGIFHPWATAAFITMIISVVIVIFTAQRVVRTREPSVAQKMILIGFAVWFIGYLPFSLEAYDSSFFGVGDRMNCVSSFGVAVFFAAIVTAVLSKSQIGGVLAVTVFVLACVSAQEVRGFEWAQSTRATKVVGECLLQREADGYPIRIREGSGWLGQSSVSVDAPSELRRFFNRGGYSISSTHADVNADDPTGASAHDLLVDPAKTLRELNCSS